MSKINWDEITHLTCRDCGETKVKESFCKRYGKRIGTYDKLCLTCKGRRIRKNYEKSYGISLDKHLYRQGKKKKYPRKPKTKLQRRKEHIKHKYNLSIEEYEELFRKQDGKCAICGTSENGSKINLDIDHDHLTGKIRGLLCNRCNRYLVALEDSEFLKNGLEYLSKNG